jgi:hypothetical protein
MTIKRNDSCPCGSGKKYKKCCLHKEQSSIRDEIKEQRVTQFNEELITKFIQANSSRVDFDESSILHQLPYDRKQAKEYLKFVRTFLTVENNGERILANIYKSLKNELTFEERVEAESWINSEAAILQYEGNTEEGISAKNLLTGERIEVVPPYSNEDLYPWSVSLALLVRVAPSTYRMLGDTKWFSPRVMKVMSEIESEAQAENKSMTKVLHESERYIETFIRMNTLNKLHEQKQNVTKHIYQYVMTDRAKVEDFLLEESNDIVIKEWDKVNGEFTWTGQWYRYEDESSVSDVYISEVLGEIIFKDDYLQIEMIENHAIEQVDEWIIPIKPYLKHEMKKTDTVQLNEYKRNNQHCVSVDHPEKVLPCYPVYAQNEVAFHQKMKKNALTTIDKEIAIKQLEYDSWRNFSSEDVPLQDVDRIRDEYGFNPSPFTVGKSVRTTKLTKSKNPSLKVKRLKKEDIPIYQKLGFIPVTARAFYAEDVLTFYRDKTEGKSAGTIKKYEHGLHLFVRFCHDFHLYQALTWNAFLNEHWEKMIAQYVQSSCEGFSKTKIKEIYATIKALAKWIDDRQHTAHYDVVKQYVDQYQDEVIDALTNK